MGSNIIDIPSAMLDIDIGRSLTSSIGGSVKKLLLGSFLVLGLSNVALAGDYDDIFIPGDDADCAMMTHKQQEYMRYNGVSVNIIKINDRLLSRRATAVYEASLSNPFNCNITCNIEVISSRGTNYDFEVIASKAHLGVFAPARSINKVRGEIEIKHGRGDDGLQWVESKGHLVSAKSCFFH